MKKCLFGWTGSCIYFSGFKDYIFWLASCIHFFLLLVHYWRLQAQEIFFSTLKRLFGNYLYGQFSGPILLGNQATYNFLAIHTSIIPPEKFQGPWTIMNKNGSKRKKIKKTNLQLQNDYFEDSFHLQLGGNWKVSCESYFKRREAKVTLQKIIELINPF